MYVIQYFFICRPPDFTVSEDAGVEPRTAATLAWIIIIRLHLNRRTKQKIVYIKMKGNGPHLSDYQFPSGEVPPSRHSHCIILTVRSCGLSLKMLN